MKPNTFDARKREPLPWDRRLNFADWLLCWLFSRFDIRKKGHLYMRRWFLGPAVFGWRLQIHRIDMPDQDRWLHDHPFDAYFWILAGGYEEELATEFQPLAAEAFPLAFRTRDLIRLVDDLPMCESDAEALTSRLPFLIPTAFERCTRTPGIRFHRARQPHRILAHLRRRTWTLALVGPRVRAWGFWTDKGWVPWRRLPEP